MFVLGEGASYGVDINTGGIADSFANFVWEPAVVKVSVCSPVVIYLISHICMQWADIFCNVGYVVDTSIDIYLLFQINAINAATEAACLVLSVDETVKNPKVVVFLFLKWLTELIVGFSFPFGDLFMNFHCCCQLPLYNSSLFTVIFHL